jgi:hypothetical protein
MTTLVTLFLLMDGVMKLVKPGIVVKTTLQLGYQESVITGLGVLLLACTVLSIIPRTSVLGAILLTGYLGGAVASHLRVEDGAFPVLFPVILGGLIWGGLVLRNSQLRSLLPIASGPALRDTVRPTGPLDA